MLKKLHHVAYRCRDAAETTQFYTEILGLKLVAALAQEEVPSISKHEPHNHIFFEMEDGSYIAFFDILEDDKDAQLDDWAQHLALEIDSDELGEEIAERLRAVDVEVLGPVDHGMCRSRYFHDPNGHRLEITIRTEGPGFWEEMAKEAPGAIEAWQKRKHAAKTST